MTHEQSALWQRIRDFRIDAPNASFPYSARLARENGWTPIYTRRVLNEYRRFAFLAVAAGHGVTPSKVVDEAWHLHLLYTRNYWDEFCPLALGRPLHHNPADGNEADDLKYEGWYDATLDSYERLFGEAPPADVWPREPAPQAMSKRAWPWLALLPFILTGCDEPANPLDWHGPPFLQLIAVAYALAFAVALLARWLLRTPTDGPPADEWGLHVYEEAYLNEGERLAFTSALARLAASREISIDPKTHRIHAEEGAQGTTNLERAILKASAAKTGARYETALGTAKPLLDEIGMSLRRQGLWVNPERIAVILFVPLLFASLPVLLGFAKIFVGLDRGRPVGFLIGGTIAAGLLNLSFLHPPKRSRYGDRVLEEFRARKHSARQLIRTNSGDPDMVAAGVALFGTAALSGTPYAHLIPAVAPVSSGGDGGSSSSCGGSSCGGGGGCGGGGCGGCGS